VIVFVSDAVRLLRKADKPVLYAANKADSPKVDPDAFELYRLGVEHVHPVSALHGRGIGDLESAIVAALPPAVEAEEPEEMLPRISITGKPNAGKSSLMNRILGEDRMLVDPRPGTTRDAIDALVERGEKRYIFVDTAGVRRKGKVTKARDAIEAASVTSAREKLSFAPFVPIVHVSAKTGRGVAGLFSEIDKVAAAFRSRVSTGELNRFFEQVLETRPPPTMGGRAPRLYYITQAETAPPLFVVISSSPDSVHFSYQRFVSNQLRKHFGFGGVPIRVVYRDKRRGKAKAATPAEED